MKQATLIPAMTLFLVMLVSCDFLLPDFDLKETEDPDPLEEGEFYAQTHYRVNNTFHVVKAQMLYADEKCEIWAETGSGITPLRAGEIAVEYNTKIRPRIVDAFSKKDISVISEGTKYDFEDMLDYADWLTDNDGKLTILLLDIKDDYNDRTNAAYVAGYFYAGNFLKKGKIGNSNFYSNGRDMIYVDINPGLNKNREQVLRTFAHELQHLVNYVTSYLLDRNYTDTWIDEGLSAYAEYLYLGKNPADKCEWFNEDPNDTIKKGNNFFVWGNHSDSATSNIILDDYATVYLFFRWLYLQAATVPELQASIFKNIITSSHSDYRAITDEAKKINSTWDTWEVLLRTWFAANYYPKNTVYGYKGDQYLQDGYGSSRSSYKGIQVKPIGGNNISLYPGEGVYSTIRNPANPAVGGANIRYAGLANNSGFIVTSPPYSGNVLLTFNTNTAELAGSELGSLTGVSSSISRTVMENAQTNKIGPYAIDARDVLGRDKPIRLPR